MTLQTLCKVCAHQQCSAVQEVEKEVWEKDASGKRKLRLVQETGYKYEEDMEGELSCTTTCTFSF